MAKTVIFNILCLTLIFGTASSQRLNISGVGTGICNGGLYKSVIDLKKGLGKCVSVTGSLELMMEKSKEEDFKDAQLNNLREITDYLVIYRVKGLESVGQLFPHLTRIRGNKLLDNFALIVYDNPSLREIGLFSLIKIDRGGVIVGVVPQACYVETVDWKSLAPQARHVIMPPDGQLECNMPCRCTEDSQNRCWNNKKCQLFLEGPEKCHDQCLGCRKTVKDDCFACRNYTYKFNCVSECPPETFLIPDNQYCITKQECHELGRLIWNTTCLSECPADYSVNNKTGESVCEPCSTHCEKNCSSLYLTSLGAVQNAEKCVYINGSISIRLGNVPGIMRDLKKYLSRIEEVSQYISIEASDVIMSLDFLPSLRVIKGENLVQNKYSLYIKSNHNLQRLFTPNVTKNLIVKNGAPMFQKNPVLCMNIIDEIKDRFPTTPSEIDIPLGSNGYRGGCEDVHFNFSITATSETSVKIRFNTEDSHIHYTALYVRVSPEVQSTVVPESCSEFEWHDADVLMVSGENYSIVELNSLQPASTYALCIEIYDPDKKRLSRSNILNFKTLVGAPELPFIFELVADSSNLVVIRWVDHKDYAEHITHYELDVMLIEMNPNVSMVDYCQFTNDFSDNDDIRHALVRRPPPQYHRGCESMCGVLSSTTPGAMTEEFFDVCDDKHFTCNDYVESVIETNTTCRNYIRTLILNIQGPKNKFQVVGLAPFSDYRFRLRACINNLCSRSARGVVRTKSSANADKISNVSANVNKSSGMVTVKWEAPEDTNGPILTYFVEILPKIKYITNIMPQVWCVRANETSIVVKSVIIPKYLIRVCLRTLASSKSCSDYVVVKLNVSMPSVEPIPSRPMPKIDLLWTGVLFGILVYIMSFLVGWLRNMRRVAGDVAPLIDSSSSFHVESEAPIIMLRNSVPYNTRSFEEVVLY